MFFPFVMNLVIPNVKLDNKLQSYSSLNKMIPTNVYKRNFDLLYKAFLDFRDSDSLLILTLEVNQIWKVQQSHFLKCKM